MGVLSTFLIIAGILTNIQGSPLLLYANRKDLRIVDAQNPRVNVTVVVGNLDDAAAVDFLYEDGYIYWTDVNLEMIQRTAVNQTHQVTDNIITTGLMSPDGLAVDWVGRKIYWTDSETDRIEVSNLDGSYWKVLYWKDLDQPRAIAVDPRHGLIFWTDWGEVPKIERAGMDGTQNTRSVIIDEKIYWPNGLTLDYEESRVIWADAKLNYIHSCLFNGRDRRAIAEGDFRHPFALALYNQTLYWTDWKTKSIHSCNKVTGDGRKTVVSNISSPMDLHTYMPDRQQKVTNPCGNNNGGCSHLCLMAPSQQKYKCACPTGVRLLEDGKNCAPGPEEMILLARRTDLRRISLDTPDFTDVVMQLKNIKHAIAIDYDPVDGYVYWTDEEVRSIRRAHIDGTGEEVVIDTEVDHPDGVAVDHIGRNLYWTDTGTDRIEVARLNGTNRKVLISEGLDEPRAICLCPEHGYMYWTDWGAKSKIERANLDGSDRVTLVDTDLDWPNGIAVDYDEGKIYWVDAKRDKIEVANLNGTGRRVLVKDNLPHVFGFSLLGDYIYWTDWQWRSIERVNKRTGGNRTLIIDQLADIMGLKAVNLRKVEGTNACGDNNGGCSHLCLFTPNGTVCACPMGLELISGGKKCIVPEAFLLFTRESDIKRMSLATDHRVMTIPIKGVQKALSLDFDINDNRIYWTDGSLQSISRAFMNGSAMERIIQFGVQYPEGMAVDWVAHNIYWADSGSKRIEMAKLDGSSRKVLIWKNLSHPRAIALDPPNGYMYWTDWSKPPKLERANLDGSNRTVIVSDLGRVHGLTIDYKEKRLYWADIDKQVIATADLSGNNRSDVVTDNIPNPMALTQYQGLLYWADWQLQTIEKANKTSGLNRTTVQGGVDNVMDILVFHHSRQSGWNMCAGNNGGCSHLCLASPNHSHHCGCPTHYTLNEDNTNCTPPTDFLLFSQKNEISRLVITEPGPNGAPDVVLPIKGLRNVKALDYDPVNEFVYWISGRSKSIRRARLSGLQNQTVVNGNKYQFKPFDLAVDPYAQLIFWSCSQRNTINFTRIYNSVGGMVVSGNNKKPRYIALNPRKGRLYYTNQANPASILRSLYDGTEEIELFVTGLSKPGPITVDVASDKLFWADMDNHVIESSDLSGGNRQFLISARSEQIQKVVGLAVFGDYLYWVDRDKKLIGRINKMTGTDMAFVQDRVPYLSYLHAAISLDPAEVNKHPCAKHNGNCSHICIVKTNNSAQCSCPVNLALNKDERTCVEKTTCTPVQFTCASGHTLCIPIAWKCDGAADCADKSDEVSCPVCGATEFQCRDGSCIPEHEVCDKKPQCPGKEDEESCCEDPHQYKCLKSDKCYDKLLYCDGHVDCLDGSDEPPTCPAVKASSSTPSLSAHYTIAIIIGVLLIAFIIIVVIACRRKSSGVVDDHDRDVIMMEKTLNSETPPTTLTSRNKSRNRDKNRTGIATTALIQGTDSAVTAYERSPLTGASSSTDSSAVTPYPEATLNPPPSPITDRSVCASDYINYTSCSPSTIRSFKKHRHRRVPPLTTPCSTDVCEDSEPYFPRKCYSNSVLELNYDSEPYAPPPTPRSQYFSDETSAPPSPSTERSYYNPYPPPPSPVPGYSDC